MDQKWQNIERIILGFLVSLTLKAGVDSGWSSSLSKIDTCSDFRHVIWSLPSLQLAIFVLTLMRFVYGAHRVLEEAETGPAPLEPWVLIWNLPGMLLLFILFYVTALLVKNPYGFYMGLAFVHIADALWFIIPALLSDKLATAPVKK